MKQVTIEVPEGKKTEWREIDGLMTLVMVDEQAQDTRPVTERIKTVEDALRALGTPEEEIQGFFKKFEIFGKDVVAYMKLRVIAEALNEGWKPKFTTDEYRYYPWFYLYTKEEIENMDEDERKQLWLFGGGSNSGSGCGLASADSGYAWSYSHSHISARLAVKTDELAVYFGKQFIDIWADYVTMTSEE